MEIEVLAPAKVNLCLHVTGRRADGYHLLDSLVVFAGVGDRLRFRPAPELTLRIEGPFGGALAGNGAGEGDNLVLRAARLMAPGRSAAITLDKRLPVAAGLGGGSADAAAALRGLARLWAVPLPETTGTLGLGADVPVCLDGRPARMRGIGERLDPVAGLPPAWLVLVNPGVAMPTGPVFAALPCRDNPPLPDLPPSGWSGPHALGAWLARTRNDLEAPAKALAPEIGTVLAAIAATPGCLLARMSGSGSSCFGLFASEDDARAAAGALSDVARGWWVVPAPLLPGLPILQETRSTT